MQHELTSQRAGFTSITMKPNWKLTDFNDRGQLKIPTGLVLVMVFLSRHLLLLLMGGISRFVGAGGMSVSSAIGLPPAWMLPINLPAILLLVLVVNRERVGNRRWWRNTMRWLVPALMALTTAQLLLLLFLKYEAILRMEPTTLVELAVLPGCLVFLAMAPKLRYFVKECSDGSAGADGLAMRHVSTGE